jgi:hypothetical protein
LKLPDGEETSGCARMLAFSAAAFGTRATSRSMAGGYMTEWTRTSAPAASFTRF